MNGNQTINAFLFIPLQPDKSTLKNPGINIDLQQKVV